MSLSQELKRQQRYPGLTPTWSCTRKGGGGGRGRRRRGRGGGGGGRQLVARATDDERS